MAEPEGFKQWGLVVLRWLAVLPSVIGVYLLASLFVELSWSLNFGGDDDRILFVIPTKLVVPYLVSLAQSWFAPYAAVLVAAYVAPNAKILAAGLAAALLVGLSAIALFGIAFFKLKQGELPHWWVAACCVISIVSACVAVHAQYQEMLEKNADEVRAQLRDAYRMEACAPVLGAVDDE